MGVDSTEGLAFSASRNGLAPFVVGENAIVGVVLADEDSVGFGPRFEGSFGFEGVLGGGGTLEMNEACPGVMVDENGRNVVSRSGWCPAHMGDVAGCGRLHLVDGDALAWGGLWVELQTGLALYAPWAFRRFAIKACCANWDGTMSKS